MRSKAHIASHPLHPILVCFPIAFFTATFFIDLLIYSNGSLSELKTTVRLLRYSGIGGAVAAAVPGMIDFCYTVPSGSSAKKRGARHGLLNTGVLILFIVAAILEAERLIGVIVLLEFAAVCLMFIAGWMGGTLVYRNQIGVDIRYAHAGRWKEIHLRPKDDRVELEIPEMKNDQMLLIHAGKKRLLLIRSEDQFNVIDDRCSHRGASLAGGAAVSGKVHCPWHGSQFCVRSGKVEAGPAERALNTYEITERGKMLIIRINP